MGIKLYLVMRQARGADQMEAIYFDFDKADKAANQIEWGYVEEHETEDDK
jgi:hypothetical protein